MLNQSHQRPRTVRRPWWDSEMHDLLDTKAAAPRIGVTAGTLENWRVQGVGPKFIKTPGKRGKVLYDPADIEAWKAERRFSSTSEVGEAA